MAALLKGSNDGPQDRDLPGPIEYFFGGNRPCNPSSNVTLIVLDWDKDTIVVKNRPILLDECVDLIAYGRFQMGQVEILFQMHTMFGLVICAEKLGIHLIQLQGWMFELAQDWSAIYIVQHVFVEPGLVRESSVIDKHIVQPPAMLWFVRNLNGRATPSQ